MTTDISYKIPDKIKETISEASVEKRSTTDIAWDIIKNIATNAELQSTAEAFAVDPSLLKQIIAVSNTKQKAKLKKYLTKGQIPLDGKTLDKIEVKHSKKEWPKSWSRLGFGEPTIKRLETGYRINQFVEKELGMKPPASFEAYITREFNDAIKSIHIRSIQSIIDADKPKEN